MKLLKCPACGAPFGENVFVRVAVCEYCDSRFVLDEDMADSVAGAEELDE